MPLLSIPEVIKYLEEFEDNPLASMYASYVITRLQAIDKLNEDAISLLASQLNKWIENKTLKLNKIKLEETAFDTVLYNALISLAAARPIKHPDLFSHKEEKIAAKELVATSDRYRFNIASLARWIRTNGKPNPFINPFTWGIFKDRDIETIKQLARENGVSLTPEAKGPEEGDSHLLTGALASMGEAIPPTLAQMLSPADDVSVSSTVVDRFEIQRLADVTGIDSKKLREYKAAESKTDTRYNRIVNCKFYLQNHKDKQDPQAAMSEEQVLKLSVEESEKLRDYFEKIDKKKITIDQVKTTEREEIERRVHSGAAPRRFFSPAQAGVPEEVESIASMTGIDPDFLASCYLARDGRYERIKQCRLYLQNDNNDINLHAAMTLDEVLKTTTQEAANLAATFSIVESELLTKETVKDLSKDELRITMQAGSRELDPLRRDQARVAALMAYRNLGALRL